MNIRFASIIAFAMLLTSCATKKSKDKNAPAGPPSATMSFSGASAAYWAATGGGTGTLNYLGKEHPFSAQAAGAGGSGAQQITGTGDVYNLNSLSDFSGTYNLVSSGFTVIRGTRHAKLTNSKGVVIYVEASTKGIASSGGASKIIISLK